MADGMRRRGGGAPPAAGWEEPLQGSAALPDEPAKPQQAVRYPAEPKLHGKAAAASDAPVAAKPIKAHGWLERNEGWAAVIVLAVALLTRFYRLDQPRGVVFDETHFGKFTNWYTENRFYFDIHPPLGKLTFWAAGKVLGYDASKCEFVDLNRPYGPECRYYLLRSVAATFSSLGCLLMFYCARGLGCSVKGAMLAAMFIIFDCLNVGEGRLILMDSQLMFWLLATLFIGQRWWAALNASEEAEEQRRAAAAAGRPAPTDARPLSWLQRKLWCVAVGIACGNACNVKMTGLVTPAVIALESWFACWFLRTPVPFSELLLVLGSAAATYSWWFAVSFWLFANTGPNKVEQEFMTPLFQATLVGSDNYDPTGASLREWRRTEGFWWTMLTHNARMIKHNANILAPHPWQSTWWEWIMNARGVAYYGKDEAHKLHTQVYLLGNSAVFLPVLAAVLLSVVILTFYARYKRHLAPGSDVHAFARQATFCLVAYAMNLAPYLGVARSTFLYHYMPALAYGQILLSRLIEVALPPAWRGRVQVALLLVVVAVYLHFAPWIYALPMTNEAHDRRRWMPRWN